jgi:hypothetical protein
MGIDLGATIDSGPIMARKILNNNGESMYRTFVRSLTPDEIQSPSEQKGREEFDAAIGKKYGLPMNEDAFKDDPDYADFVTSTYDFYEDDEVPAFNMSDIDDIKIKDYVDTYDQYLGDQLRVRIADEIRTSKVVLRKIELDGTVKGRANANSILDTRTYEIEFPDGHIDEYTEMS